MIFPPNRDNKRRHRPPTGFRLPRWLACAILLFFNPGAGMQNAREEGRFRILVAGKEIGQERFSIQFSPESVQSESTVTFRNPGKGRQNVRIESRLTMNGTYLPQTYQVSKTIEKHKGIVEGTFVEGEANFEYEVDGIPRKSGLLLGDDYLILDSNVFHHFIFVARRFDFGRPEAVSQVQVVIPQEIDSGLVRIRNLGAEEIRVQGKKRDLHRLRVDSGSLLIDLWIDGEHNLYKVALPSRDIEVVRQ